MGTLILMPELRRAQLPFREERRHFSVLGMLAVDVRAF